MNQPHDYSSDLPLGLGAAALTTSAAFGYVRVFAETEPVVLAIAAAAIASLLAIGLRLARIGPVFSTMISLASMMVLISLWFAPDTQAWALVPTGDTINALKGLVTSSSDEYRSISTPITGLNGFVIAAAGSSWLLALLTDLSAVRLRLSFETVLPSLAVFGFASVVGSGHELISSLVFGLGVLIWAVVRRLAALKSSHTWIAADAKRGPSSALVGASILGVVAILTGLVFGPRLPGYEEPEIYSYRYTAPDSRSPITPYVEISDRLVEQNNIKLFTVKTDNPQYWRIVSLENYENNIWKTSNRFGESSGSLNDNKFPPGDYEIVRHQVTIGRLGTIWAPAAYAPSEVITSSVPLIWNSDIATLTIKGDDSVSFNRGDTYTLESIVANNNPETLRTASTEIPSDIAEKYLGPDEVTPTMVATAQSLTADAPTVYDKAMALQAYFQSFDYSTDLGPRVGDPIDQFLTERVGFCQQFSSVFALMARSLGIPARVAIGFTWGDLVEGTTDLYQVMGKHAHAWPEIWMGEYGWVAFEPTPGRGSPATAAYTGQEPAQDSAVQSTIAEAPTTPTTAPDAPAAQRPNQIEDQAPNENVIDTGLPETETSWSPPLYQYLIVGTVLAYIGLMFGIRWFRRQFRRSRIRNENDKVLLAWSEAEDALRDGMSLSASPAETRTEFAARVATKTTLSADPLHGLSQAATLARYRSDEPPAEQVNSALSASSTIVSEVKDKTTLGERLVAVLSPRRLFRRR